MRRVRITLPATITNIGPALGGLGLAVNLKANLEFLERTDDKLSVECFGAGSDVYDNPIEHPAVLAAIRVFQQYERSPLGFNLRVENQIPVTSGLGAEDAFTVAGVLGAANLINADVSRENILLMAARILGKADGVVASMLGGLTAGVFLNDRLSYRSLAPVDMQVVVIVPEIKRYTRRVEKALIRAVSVEDVMHNLTCLPLMVDALQRGDMSTLDFLIEDRVQAPVLKKYLTGFDEVTGIARKHGASALSISGNGPAMVCFAHENHHAIAEAIKRYYEEAGLPVQTWVLPVDRQGIIVSMTQSTR